MNVLKTSKCRLFQFLSGASISLLMWSALPEEKAHADVLASIARCESHGQQFDPSGRVLRNRSNRSVVGIFQINERIHGSAARRLGLNIYTPAGNWAYARHLLHNEGTAPWLASRSCWGGGGYASRTHRRRIALRSYTPRDTSYAPSNDGSYAPHYRAPHDHSYAPSGVGYYASR